MTIANVALTDTFDLWRTRTNQLAVQSNVYEVNIPDLYNKSNNSPSYVYANNIGVQANSFANSIGVQANNFASATIAGANTAVGNGANNFFKTTLAGANTTVGNGANSFLLAVIAGANTAVGNGANNFMLAVQNGSNVAVGIGANNFASLTIAGANSFLLATIAGANSAVGTAANNFATATIAGANSAVGTAANNFTKATLNGANTAARDASNLTTGTVPSARITGVGTIDTGTWNATNIALNKGGTNASLTACSGAVVYSTSSAFSFTAVGTSGQLLQSGATGAPSWISPASLTVGNATKLATLDAAYSATALTIPARDSAADIQARLFRSEYTDQTGIEGAIAFRSNNTNDNYIRFCNTASAVRTWLGLGTIATQGSDAVSITGGSISGLSSLGVSGDITATGDITAFSSDARLKGDIQTITDALSKVKLITGITYIHNDIAKSFGYTDEKRLAGVLAQEVEAVLPEVVVPAPFDVADDGTSKSGENYKTVKYEKIVPLLIEAIKELTAKVEMLESRVNE
jgi:hypothetical protein